MASTNAAVSAVTERMTCARQVGARIACVCHVGAGATTPEQRPNGLVEGDANHVSWAMWTPGGVYVDQRAKVARRAGILPSLDRIS